MLVDSHGFSHPKESVLIFKILAGDSSGLLWLEKPGFMVILN